MKQFSLSNATLVTPDVVSEQGALSIEGETIKDVGAREVLDIPLNGRVLCPAFINAHDHLLGTYYPKVGHGPYSSWYPWDLDLKACPLYEERSKIANEDLYYLGSYRNMLSGALTVSDHIPHQVNDPFIPKMPIRIIKDYCLAHEVSAYDLKWGDGVDVEYARAVENDMPFITHLEEGFDSESRKGTTYLREMNAISEHSVLVHCIVLSLDDIRLMAKQNANLVWCAASNWFMFKRTARVKEWLKQGINVSIGTDSPMSGGANILEEMRFCKRLYEKTLYPGETLPYETIVKMVTVNPAKAFRLRTLGRIAKGMTADLLVIENKGDPYGSIVNAELKDIHLIIHKGLPIYSSGEYFSLFDEHNLKVKKIRVEGETKYCLHDVKGLLYRIRKAVGFSKELPFLPVD